jgi:hypothetical protein
MAPAVSSGRTRAGRDPADAGVIRAGALWFGLFGAPFFWSAQLIITYALAAHTCYPRHAPLLMLTSPPARAAVCTVIVAALGGSAAATVVAVRNCRSARFGRAGAEAGRDATARAGRTRFLAYSGVLLGALFTGGVVMSGAAVLLLPMCW